MSRPHLPTLPAGNYFALEVVYLQEIARRYSLAVFACLFLVVAGSGIAVGAAYWSARITILETSSQSTVQIPAFPQKGPNAIVASSQLAESLQKITSQPISLTITDKAIPLEASTIQSWVKTVVDHSKGVTYLHVDQAAVAATLKQVTAPYVKAPVNQITATYTDGSSRVIVAGRNGTQVHDTDELSRQIGASVLGGKGFQLTVPTDSLPFAALTPAAFDKLLEVNVVTKQMYVYEKGQLIKTYPISAGAPATPTPLGRFEIYQKLTVQDMRGFNADGTRYFQPHVRWVNYFLPGGYAVHGNYWRAQSWFGAINSSHGCVSLPDVQAEWIYNWAPIGTTVITHA